MALLKGEDRLGLIMDMPDSSPASWFHRNWLWVVPGTTLLLIVLLILMTSLTAVVRYEAVTSSELFQDALRIVQNHPLVTAALGSPIEAESGFEGGLFAENNRRQADLEIPIRGPKGRARLMLRGVHREERWVLEEFRVEIATTGRVIDLMAGR